jgi:hypothetical protein
MELGWDGDRGGGGDCDRSVCGLKDWVLSIRAYEHEHYEANGILCS